MNKDEFLFEITASDGKKYNAEITLLNVNAVSGSFGIMKDHVPVVAFLGISTFNIITKGEKKYFAVSEGVLRVEKGKAVIVAGTFEDRDELDKDRILHKKEEAERKISSCGDKELGMMAAEVSLKKALNRLSLLEK